MNLFSTNIIRLLFLILLTGFPVPVAAAVAAVAEVAEVEEAEAEVEEAEEGSRGGSRPMLRSLRSGPPGNPLIRFCGKTPVPSCAGTHTAFCSPEVEIA